MNNKEDRSDIVIGGGSRRGRVARFACSRPWVLWFLAAARQPRITSTLSGSKSLGFASVFWTRISLRPRLSEPLPWLPFCGLWSVPGVEAQFARPTDRGHDSRQPAAGNVTVEPVLKLIGLGLSVAIAAVTGASMMERWMTLALFWDARVTQH